MLQLKSKEKNESPLNFEKVFNEIEKKTWSELSEWTSK